MKKGRCSDEITNSGGIMVKGIKAAHGEKMIELRVKFWTNGIASSKDEVFQKNAWDSGMLVLETNHLHGIKNIKNVPFHSMSDLPGKIEKMLIAHGIILRHGRHSGKLYGK